MRFLRPSGARFYRFNSTLNNYELTKRLSIKQHKKVEASFRGLEKAAVAFTDNLQADPYYRWDINSYKNWTTLALMGRIGDRLTDNQVATVSLIQSAVKSYLMEFREVKVSEVKVKRGSALITEDRVDHIGASRQVSDPYFIAVNPSREEFYTYLKIHFFSIAHCYADFDDKAKKELFCERLTLDVTEKLKEAPRSERFLFLVPLISNVDISNYDRLLKRLLKLKEAGFSLLNVIKIKDVDYLLFFSFSLMQLILDKLSPDEKIISLSPTFGNITIDEIYEAKKERRNRLVSIGGISGVDLPDKADTYFTTDFSVSEHDCYHGFKDNAVLEKWRLATFEVINLLSKMKELLKYNDEDIEQLLFFLKDGDLETDFKLKSHWGKTLEIPTVRCFLKEKYLTFILEDMVKNENKWNKIGISRKDLTERQKIDYDLAFRGR